MGAPRQDRTRPIDFRFLLLALVTFSGVAGVYLVDARRASTIDRAHRASESRALDERFGSEAARVKARLEELKTEAIRAIPVGDRGRFPAGVVSATVWSRTPNGFVRTLGLEPFGVWEQALYRVLPAAIARRNAPVVLPLVGPELNADPSAETLRLALFPESGADRVAAIAFRPSALLAGSLAADGMKRYLIEESGLVLAHTNPAEVGVRTSALADLYRREERASSDPTRAHRLASKSWEGFPTTIRFTRLPGWGAYFVMEKVHAPVRAATNPLLILILISGSLLGILFASLAFLRARPTPVEVFESKSPARAPVEVPAPPAPAPAARIASAAIAVKESRSASAADRSAADRRVDSELARFIAAREARSETFERNRLRREKILLEEFETEVRRVRSRERLEEKLVESISGATRSPVLFFRYDPLQGVATLSAKAGSPSHRSIIGAGGMSFALGTALVADVHAEVARGRALNLGEYPPLSRVMLSRLGIANFEAWPMTETRNPNVGPSRLLGVLVVAESGSGGVLHRDFMGALLDRASRHYARQTT